MSAFAIIAAIATSESPPQDGDYFCGPRTAHFVAQWYNRNIELLEVIREVQEADSTDGVSILRIKQYLDNHGIGTFIIRSNKPTIANWKHPVILHLRPQSGTLGHFVVLLPPEGNQEVTVWDGLDSFKLMPRTQLANKMSGVALVTAPGPISRIEDVIEPEFTNPTASGIGVIVVIGVVALWWRCKPTLVGG